MRSGRVQRLLGGLSLGYLHTAGTILVGLWLTPYLLGRLGSHDYGLWLLGTQVVVYLSLLDLGVVARIPRDVAGASGRPDADRLTALHELIGQAGRLVLYQLPSVAFASAIVVWLLPAEWSPLRGPLSVVVITFVVAFPFRVFVAVLQGLQDLAFVGIVQLVSWAAGTATTVGGVIAGFGLYSLALGWVTTQAVSVVLPWMRLARVFPDVVPRRLPSMTLSLVRQQFGRSVWISVGQLAQVLLSGTDLVVIGKLLGPAAVVPYVCTGKLLTMLSNQPQMFMQLALPALSELRASAPRHRLFEVSKSLTQVMLLGSGAIVTAVLMVNQAFVAWWVGEAQFAGIGLTALLLGSMLLRHINVTAVYALFCFGNERRLAVTTIAEGAVSVAVMLLLVPRFGLYGAAFGPLIATCLVSLPSNLRALAREEEVSPLALLTPLWPWLARLSLLLGGVAAFLSTWTVQGLPGLIIAAAAAAVAYLVTMLSFMRTPPLGPSLAAVIRPWTSSARGALKRLTGQPLTQSQ
ncbi:MAG TPA: polysaccharide biosynthesis C-terminal domain-containing protein [Vicinamibacterales bacterium]|nr:polysaccharide biosynthesis C-terminal domain-containing protein [Vicinamibacterales bacterium]